MQLKLNLIAAASENMGIGINGDLPWRLKSEMAFFTRMTTNTKDPNKKNVVLMGRRTWECIPKKYKPLRKRINMVLSTQTLHLKDEAIPCKSISDALSKISKAPLKDVVESIWVIGGSSVYRAAMESPNFHRLYLTKVLKHFDCDTFFPEIPNNFALTSDPEVPKDTQEENGISFKYLVYQRN
ncbi:dihydrofolate reductase [Orussus abietinus]|uniref:dihydrofolate reductase n=1 Tax=Orussus abietinus TaxID=222816 RepID=UPI0006250A0E|nr:dihydrofolate reductase [Orussus abietinus]